MQSFHPPSTFRGGQYLFCLRGLGLASPNRLGPGERDSLRPLQRDRHVLDRWLSLREPVRSLRCILRHGVSPFEITLAGRRFLRARMPCDRNLAHAPTVRKQWQDVGLLRRGDEGRGRARSVVDQPFICNGAQPFDEVAPAPVESTAGAGLEHLRPVAPPPQLVALVRRETGVAGAEWSPYYRGNSNLYRPKITCGVIS